MSKGLQRGFAQFINEHLATQSISFLENITCEGNSAVNNCSQAFEEIALNVSAYRAANDGMHRALFSHWYEGQDDNRKSMIRNCFTQNEYTNSIDPYTIRFDNHHSQLQTRPGIPATTCVGLQTLWQNQVRQELPKVKANPSDYGVSPIDAFVVQDFENSRLKAMVDDTSWSNPNMSQQEMRQRIYDDLREIPARMLAMGEQIENFSNSQLEHIYLFRDFYEQEYLPSLSNLEVGTLYPTCMQRNDRGICFRSVFADEEEIEEQHVDRCLSRAAELGLDLFIPGHMVVSGQRSINFAREALVSGLINYQDYYDESSSYAGEMLMGIPVGGVVSAALPRVAVLPVTI